MINIYKASAGSGKTFTLAREYIKLILGHKNENGDYVLSRNSANNHRSVLAITFTNKATEEMKSRIIHELAVIAGCEKNWNEKSPYEADLCKTFRCNPEELKSHAVNVLHDLLYDFNFFSVSTIDSFFQLILRSFAHEAEVSGNYEVELDDDNVISMSVDNLLQDLNHDTSRQHTKYPVKWLSNYMIQLIEDGKSFNLFNRSSYVHDEFVKFIGDITDDTFRENETEIVEYLSDLNRFEEFKDAVFSKKSIIKKETAEACRQAVEAIEQNGLVDGDVIYKNLLKALRNWSATGYYPDDKGNLQAAITKACENIDSAYKANNKNAHLRTEHLDGIISYAVEKCKYCYDTVKTLNILSSNLYQLGLFSTIIGYIDKYRRENSTILLSDTNALLARIIGNEDTPFLYERVGVWYHHYLIDEFQDTSFSQWQNLRPLIYESLSYDYDNLVIGDEKQCIYRFRNSDPSLLHNLHTEQDVEGRAIVSGNTIAENTNWRSSADVIRFNNTIFSAIAKNLGYDGIYENVAQQISSKHSTHRGYVKVSLLTDKEESEAVQKSLDILTADLHRQLTSGYRPGDIAILVRTWKEGERIIRHLESVKLSNPDFPNFQIVSDSSLRISRSPSISLIISRLRLLCASERVTKGNKKTQKEIAAIINAYEAEHGKGLSSSEALSKVLTGIDSKPSTQVTDVNDATTYNKEMDLISLIESIIDEIIPKDRLHTDNVFISAFLDLASDFVARGHGDIRSFLTWWDESGYKSSIAGAKDDSSLNILTIHKSKGLEFPCVHVPFGELKSTGHADLAWFKVSDIPGIKPEIIPPMIPLKIIKAMEGTMFEEHYNEVTQQKTLDTLNLLYVAFTRAVDELCVNVITHTKASSFADTIVNAISTSTEEFCSRLLSSNGIENKENSPFIPLSFDSDDTLTIGQPTFKQSETSVGQKTASSPANQTEMPDYYIRSRSSIWENTKLDKYHDIEVARERGILLHDLMAHIKTPADIPNAINILKLSPEAKSLKQTDIQEIRYLITQRVNDNRVTDWFNDFKRVLIERPIASSKDATKRPDRVVWTKNDEIHVIDYKSGNQPPERYKKQLKEYVSMLSTLGYKNVYGFVYYLDTGTIIKF